MALWLGRVAGGRGAPAQRLIDARNADRALAEPSPQTPPEIARPPAAMTLTVAPERARNLHMAQKLTLEWTKLENGERALVFDAATWDVFEKCAQLQGKTAHQLISTAVAGSLGTTMMDNYALNRWLKNDDPEFFRR
jgi:hypothetical protein